MPAPLTLALLVLAGFGLGIVFYGGLWLTLRGLGKSKHPVVLVLGSFWGRTAIVIAGLILAMDTRWERALVCMAGFVLARAALARWIPRGEPGRGGV